MEILAGIMMMTSRDDVASTATMVAAMGEGYTRNTARFSSTVIVSSRCELVKATECLECRGSSPWRELRVRIRWYVVLLLSS